MSILNLILFACCCVYGYAELTNSCTSQNCRWNLIREAEDNTKVIVYDSSVHRINWKWDVRGGHWNVTYVYKYPSEWYSGKAVFVNSSITAVGDNAFVSWGSATPWTSNSVPIYGAKPWNITYNGDVFGFTPTQGGRYFFRVFTKNKRHDPFAASEPMKQPPGPCSFGESDPAKLGKWWQDQKSSGSCTELALAWTWPGKAGKWTVFYRYVESTKQTICDVYYEGPAAPQIKVITWQLDELRQSASYATNPVRIYENGWQVALTPAETWGFTPTGDGLWVFQHYSRNLVFQPFRDFRGTLVYSASPAQIPVVPQFQPSYATLPSYTQPSYTQPSYTTLSLPPVVMTRY